MIRHKIAKVDGLHVFYREAGDPANPKLVLLHGFPASSHQYRNLMAALEDRFYLLAPDYPGFGNTDMPDPAAFDYTFDRLSEITEGLLVSMGFDRFGVYMQDYGGPVGNRIVGRHPEWLEWQIVQNSNAYEEGFTEVWDAFRHALWQNRNPETEAQLEPFLERDGVMQIYLHGHKDPEKISPDNWNMDLLFLARPNAHQVQLDLFYDYRTNVELYPEWQAFLREHRPPTLILWGENDIIFAPEGGRAYLRDLPDAEVHMLDSGHFAVEDHLDVIAEHIKRFYGEKVATAPALWRPSTTSRSRNRSRSGYLTSRLARV
jgi:pimeloyl-ACP methyl ester carboxylesterase